MKCTRCDRELEYKPRRLNEYKYNNSGHGYKQYLSARRHYDLCKKCYKKFKMFIENEV